MSQEENAGRVSIPLQRELEAFRLKEAVSLKELKSRHCSNEELQSFLIKLTELYNEQGLLMEAAINKLKATKLDREWRANM